MLFLLAGSLAPPSTTLPVEPPDRPALDAEWLIDVGGFHIGTRTYITAAGVTYRARLLNAPQITRSLSEEWFGFTELAQLQLRIDNTDGAYDALWDSRGLPVVVTRLDRETLVSVVEFEGVVDRPTLDAGDAARVRALEIEAFNQDLRVLETKIPKRVTSTTLFGATCPNPGKTIPKIVGTVPLVPLIYVRDDVPGILFDYLIGEGTSYTVSEVRRDRIGNQQPQLLAPSEYSVVTYSGVTVIRTARRQLKGGGGFHQLYASVSGPAGERNFGTFAGVLMGDTTWGASLTVDAASITAAAALVPAGLVIDGVLSEAKPASEWLRSLLELRGGRPQFSATLGWGLTLDTPLATAKMFLRDEPGPGVRTMLAHGRRRQPGLNDDVATLRVQYAPNLLTGEGYTYETSPRTVSDVGAETVLTHDLLRDRTSADIWACYMANKMRDPDVVEGAVVTEEGRTLFEGDVVQVTSSPLLLAGVDRQILSIEKGTGRHTLRHRRYDPADYVYTSGVLPPIQTIDSSTVPPTDPTGLVLTTGTTLIDDHYVAWANLTWNRNPEPDMGQYNVRFRQVGTVAWVSFPVPHPPSGATVTHRAEAHLPSVMTFEVQIQAEDVWGLRSAWVPSTPAQITIAADPSPATPTGLTLSTGIESAVAQDGSYLAWVQATWNRNSELDILKYNVEGRLTGATNWQSAGSISQTTSGSPVMRIPRLPPGIAGEMRVQAQDRDGHLSAFCAPVSITTATFATAPSPPTGVAAVGGSTTIRVTWNRQDQALPHLTHYEVHEGTSSGFAIVGTGEVLNGTCIAHVGAASYVKAFAAGQTFPVARHYKIVTVITGGIRSAASANASGTATGVASSDIASKEVKTPNIDDRAIGALQRVTYTAVAGAYPSLAPGAAFADSVTHGMGQIPAISIDTSRLEILWHVYDITNSIFAFVLWNAQPGGGSTIPADTAIAYYR